MSETLSEWMWMCVVHPFSPPSHLNVPNKLFQMRSFMFIQMLCHLRTKHHLMQIQTIFSVLFHSNIIYWDRKPPSYTHILSSVFSFAVVYSNVLGQPHTSTPTPTPYNYHFLCSCGRRLAYREKLFNERDDGMTEEKRREKVVNEWM